MKKIISIVSIVILVSVSCGKGEMIQKDSNSGRPMLFSVEGNGSGSKATFNGSTGALFWEDSDNLGIYMFNSSGELKQSDQSVLASNSGSTAFFAPSSATTVDEWIDGITNDTDNCVFAAYYPVSSKIATATDGVISLSVPSTQDGTFGTAQICYATKTMTKYEVASSASVAFSFSPLTSMIRLRLILDATSPDATASINKIVVSSSDSPLAWTCSLDLKTGVLSTTSTTKQVTVSLAIPITVTKIQDNNPYINIIVLPTSATENILITAYTTDGVEAYKSIASPTSGFISAKRYNLDVSAHIVHPLISDSFDWAKIAEGSSTKVGSTANEVKITNLTSTNGWTSNERCWARGGYFRLGQTGYAGTLTSPSFASLTEATDVNVSFKAARWVSSSNALDYFHEFTIEIVGSGTPSQKSFTIDNYSGSNPSAALWQDDPAATYTFTITGANADTQVKFIGGPSETLPATAGGATKIGRMLIDDFRVSLK